MRVAVGGLKNELPTLKDATFEILAEEHMGLGGLHKIPYVNSENVKIGVTETCLSLGSSEKLDENYLNELIQFLKITKAEWLNIHLAFSKSGDIYFHGQLPVIYSKASLEFILRKLDILKSVIAIPIYIENINHKSQ